MDTIRKGVYFHKTLKKFMVNIRFMGENYHIGYFSTQEEAFAARDKSLAELFGSDAPVVSSQRKKKIDKLKERLKTDKGCFLSEADKVLLKIGTNPNITEIIS